MIKITGPKDFEHKKEMCKSMSGCQKHNIKVKVMKYVVYHNFVKCPFFSL